MAWAFRKAAPNFRPREHADDQRGDRKSATRRRTKNRYYPQVKGLLGQGMGVKGIGFQFHFFSPERLTARCYNEPTYAPQAMLDVYEQFADFNLPLYVTEITIPTPAGDGEAVQAEVVGNFYRLWFRRRAWPASPGGTWATARP